MRALLVNSIKEIDRVSAELQEFIDTSESGWKGTLGASDGPAINAAQEQVSCQLHGARATLQEMSQARWALSEALNKHFHFPLSAPSPTDWAVLEIRDLLELEKRNHFIDSYCADKLNAICAPHSSAPLRKFSDFQGMPMQEVHDYNYQRANNDVRAVLADNPDTLLMEAGENQFVVEVLPAGMDPTTTPAAVTTYVPGVGSSNPKHYADKIVTARAIAEETDGPVIVWAGYHAPTLAQALDDKPIHEGGDLLRDFQHGVNLRWPDAKKTIVAHSLGTDIVGDADLRRNDVDNIVILGSPGIPQKLATEFGAHVRSYTSKIDPIQIVANAHGTDPTSKAYGACEIPGTNDLLIGHTGYLKNQKILGFIGDVAHGTK